MKYTIISDSSADMFTSDDGFFKSVPFKIITDQKEYTDTPELNVDEMISDLKSYKGQSKSSCPNCSDWSDTFGDSNRIICVAMTSALSGSYNTANLALNEHLNAFPEKKGFVIDTLSTGPENVLIIEKLKELIGSSNDIEKIKEKIDEYKQKTHLIFSLESLNNLANNGRVSQAVSKISGIFGIRVIGKASDMGTLEVTNKSRGADKAISIIFSNMLKTGYNGGKVRIHHCNNTKCS